MLLAAAGLAQILDAFASMGKKPMVAPYSGAMLAMVARSTTASAAAPGP
jgi:Na+/phosphate symporter